MAKQIIIGDLEIHGGLSAGADGSTGVELTTNKVTTVTASSTDARYHN